MKLDHFVSRWSVKFGDGCKLHSHINIQGDVEVGNNTEIFPFVSIGSIPQDLKYKGEKTKLKLDQIVNYENM